MPSRLAWLGRGSTAQLLPPSPGEVWARRLAFGIGVWIAGSWLACILSDRPVTLADVSLANASFVAGRVVVYGFGAIEAFRYAGMLRRQVALGLADPVAPHQIRLWGIAWLCVAAIAVGSIGVSFLGGQRALEAPLFTLVGSSLNAAAWVCTWLAFFPPPRIPALGGGGAHRGLRRALGHPDPGRAGAEDREPSESHPQPSPGGDGCGPCSSTSVTARPARATCSRPSAGTATGSPARGSSTRPGPTAA